MYARTVLSCFFILIQAVTLAAQQTRNLSNIYVWFDSVVGEDASGLYNGTLYSSNLLTNDNNHPYFEWPNFTTGTLEYDGQVHYEVLMKYDLLNDEIIVSPKNTSGSLSLRLVKGKVKSFFFQDHEFAHLAPKYSKSKENLGFCEVILTNELFGLYKKLIKEDRKASNKGMVFTEFEPSRSYYLSFKDEFYKVKSKRDFIRLFPEQKTFLNDYYKSFGRAQESDSDKFFISMLETLHTLLLSETSASK